MKNKLLFFLSYKKIECVNMPRQQGISIWTYFSAGLIAIILTVIISPIWAMLNEVYSYTNLTLFIIGIVLILIGTILDFIHKLRSIKVFLMLTGFAMTILFMYLALPWFSISIV